MNISTNLKLILMLKIFVSNLKKLLKSQINNVRLQITNNSKTQNELLYRNIFVDSTIDSIWFKNKALTLIGGAMNYSFALTLYKVLEEWQPNKILEFGLGQSSLITSQYANHFNKSLTIVEHNEKWANHFSKKLTLSSYSKLLLCPLETIEFNNTKTDKYQNLQEKINDDKFNLIIIDGPIGYDKKYPRIDILDLIPNNINTENFVIILDDAERIGEKNTTQLILDKLNKNNINYLTSTITSLKSQFLITSTNNEYLHWYKLN